VTISNALPLKATSCQSLSANSKTHHALTYQILAKLDSSQLSYHNFFNYPLLQYVNTMILAICGTLEVLSQFTYIALFQNKGDLKTRCSAIAERPRCRVHYSFRQK